MHSGPDTEDLGVYVYCVTHAAPFVDSQVRFTSPAIGGRGGAVRAVLYEDVAAVVSDSPKIRYTLRREFLEAHEHVVEEAMTCSDVLPVSFGTVADTEEQVREQLLRRRLDDLHGYLDYVKDRVELDLKAYWVQEQLFAEVVAENPQIQWLRESVAQLPPDAAYYDRIQLGELTEAAIGAKRDQEAESVLAQFEPLAVETKVNKELTDMMILNAAFLVDKVRERQFDERVQSLGASRTGRIHLQYVGPVPPYNFVTLRVRWGA